MVTGDASSLSNGVGKSKVQFKAQVCAFRSVWAIKIYKEEDKHDVKPLVNKVVCKFLEPILKHVRVIPILRGPPSPP